MKTPRTDTAAYNGHTYLVVEAKKMEVEIELMRESLEWLRDAIDRGQWHHALSVIEDIAKKAEEARDIIEEHSNQGN